MIVGNKHQAIVFYNKGNVIRLVVLEKSTDLMQCVDKALSQKVGNLVLEELLAKHKVKKEVVDMREQAIFTKSNSKEQMDVGSCDRLSLLKSMLEGSYTESETEYGNSDRSAFKYYADICVNYHLVTDKETFDISHKGAFINSSKTRVIPIQLNGSITEQELEEVLLKL